MSDSSRQHVIIIGASMMGLLAARVLSEHFARVTVLDRDRLPDRPEPRKGVPQSQHIHVLLRRGMLIFAQLFPGIDADLAQAGARQVDWTDDFAWYTPAGWGPRFASGFNTRACSRGLIEYTIRQRVTSCANVTIKPRCEAIRLIANESRSTVIGVEVNDRDRNESSRLQGDLVIDASGRSSRAAEWLSGSGYPSVEETVLNAFVGYATRVYRRPARSFDWKVLMIRSRPPFGTSGGVIYPIENDQWIVNIGGAGSERPPTDEAGFVEFARTLISPAMYDAFTDAEPVSPIHGYQRTENRWRHYERMTRWPDNFIVMGDAMCGFNPLYGQGMSVAGLEALALDRWLKQQADCGSFQKQLAGVIKTPWLMAMNEDSRIPGVVGAQPGRLDKMIHRYLDEVQWLAAKDKVAFETFVHVSHLVDPPTALFRPSIVLKVIRRMLRKNHQGRSS